MGSAVGRHARFWDSGVVPLRNRSHEQNFIDALQHYGVFFA
jgi:hypothetical protein